MIQLRSLPKPDQLTEELVAELTERFKQTGESVWKNSRVSFLKEALLELSHRKCCYSECKLEQEGKYMEVEHFHPKSLYPDEVLDWNNLLPANRKCNGDKGSWDTKTQPIIHPVRDNPKEHLFLKNYRFHAKTPLGQNTLQAIDLNNRQHWVQKRFRIGEQLIKDLKELEEQLLEYEHDRSENKKKKILNRLAYLLCLGIETEEYSATIATVMLHHKTYQAIKARLIAWSYWNEELTELEQRVAYCCMDENHNANNFPPP
ncbi:MAG: HNH endonuclease domain-containing protein [Spirosomataceae bacterium]